MPAELEAKLKREYGDHSDVPYKIMNHLKLMHGNKETAKGKAMDKRKSGNIAKLMEQK